MTAREVAIFDRANEKVARPVRETALSGALIGKGNYRHFMQKEIFEQPSVIGDTLQALVNPATRSVHLPDLPFALGDIGKITTVACGTAHHAGMIAKYWLERIARIPVEADIASEFRYRAPAMPRDGAALVISQSGETADTLAALRYCREAGQKIIAVVNQPESSIAREADIVLADPGRAGNRRRLDQGVHDAARGSGRVHGRDGAGARHDRRRRRGGARRPARRNPVARQRGSASRRAAARDRRGDRAGPRRALSRPRHVLPAGPRRRA